MRQETFMNFLMSLCLSFFQVSEIEASNEKLQSMESQVALSEETIASLKQDKSSDEEVKSNFENEMQECKKQIVDQESQRERLIASMDEQESLHQTQIRQLNAKLEEAENNCVDATMQLLTSTVQLQETEEQNTILFQKSTAMQESLKVSLIFFFKILLLTFITFFMG